MKYCLFCRDSFEDRLAACPRCGGPLVDSAPVEDRGASNHDEETPPEHKHPKVDSFQTAALVAVAIVDSEDDLRAAVDVLDEHGVYFEIEQGDSAEKLLGVVSQRSWRLLVREEDGQEAFLKLVEKAPEIFPPDVIEAMEEEKEDEEEPTPPALARISEILDSGEAPKLGSDLARAVIEGFAGEDSPAIARAKYELARRGAAVAPLVSEIAAASIADGGEGAERILYNLLEVLEAIGYARALEKIVPLYKSPVSQVRARAAYASGRLGAPEAVTALLDLLADPDDDVRYEASESIWRLTGFDFDFDPYNSPEEEASNVEALRKMWDDSGHKGRVRERVDLAALLRAIAEG